MQRERGDREMERQIEARWSEIHMSERKRKRNERRKRREMQTDRVKSLNI